MLFSSWKLSKVSVEKIRKLCKTCLFLILIQFILTKFTKKSNISKKRSKI